MRRVVWIGLLILTSVTVSAGGNPFRLRMMTYNVENLFDCDNDSLTQDDEFLPTSQRYWGYKRYQTKLANIAKVIVAAGEWNPPVCVALCEIENRKVLDDLTRFGALKNLGYKVAHFDSPDERGVDVGLLYLPKHYKVYQSTPIHIRLSSGDATRDVLWTSGTLANGDTLHCFVVHAPSRRGGEMASRFKRVELAHQVRPIVDSLMRRGEYLLVMGDFNDYPDSDPIMNDWSVSPLTMDIQPHQLYNLCYDMHSAQRMGSYKFNGDWVMLDQIWVSGTLLLSPNASVSEANVFAADWLLEADEKHGGNKPKRTYLGYKYRPMFSDHLPLYVDLVLNE